MADLFEENIKSVLSHFKSGKKRSENRENSSKKKNARPTRNNGAGASTSQGNHNSGDSDDDDDDEQPNGKVNGRSRRTQAQSNGVSSSSNTRDSQASVNKKSRNLRVKSSAEEESDESESSSDDSTNSDESSGIPLSELGRNKAVKKVHRTKKNQQKRGAVSSSSPKKNSRNAKRRKIKPEVLSEPEAENTDNDSHESKSARSTPELTTSRRSNRQTAKRRIRSSSEEVGESSRQGRGDEKQKRICKRPKRYESDQSFHVEGPKNKTADSDSDKPRATRESAKKKFQEWALTSEDDDDDDEDFNQKPQTSSQAQKSAARRAIRKKANVSGSDHSDEKKAKPGPSRRSARVQRTSQSQEDESEETDEQNKPSTSTNVTSNSRVSNGVAQAQTSQQSRTTRSQNQPTTARGTINDHNYGEPGPSSTASVAPRQTRSAILSRHQRNADELDRSTLEDGSLASSTQNPRLLRLRSSNVRSTPSGNFELLNGIRRTTRNRVMHNYFEDENENDNEDTTRAMQPLHQGSSRLRIKQEPPRDDPSDDSDSYSEEDKTPLKLMASSSKKIHEHNTRNGTAVNRVKRNLDLDEELVG